MKKYLDYIPFAVIVLLVFLVLEFSVSQESYIPSLKVLGDVDEVITIDSIDQYETTKFVKDGTTYTGIKMETIVTGMLDENSSLYYVGGDGLVAQVQAHSIGESYLLYTADHGWEIMNLQHPVSSNIKDVEEIIVVSNEEFSTSSFTIYTDTDNVYTATVGQMLIGEYTYMREWEGESLDSGNTVSVYTSHRVIPLESLIGEVQQAVIFQENGAISFDNTAGYLDIQDNQITYHNGDTQYDQVVGIYLGDTYAFVGDAYYHMDYYLRAGEKVLTIFIDGLGYEILETAMERDLIPNISSGEIVKAFSVHTSVTNAGFASMITGTTPDINGVHSREERELLVDSIFATALELELQTSFLEGDIQILNTEIAPTLHLSGDMQILDTALVDIKGGAEFCFLHLHELDNYGHMYGPKGEALYDYLEEIDVEVGKLIEEFDGKVIITTDHGMHQDGEGGNHGTMRYEDMIIPIIYIK